EELGVLRDRAGPAALDEPHPELVEERSDRELVADREVHALLLRAVAEGGVVDVDVEVRAGRWDGGRAHRCLLPGGCAARAGLPLSCSAGRVPPASIIRCRREGVAP